MKHLILALLVLLAACGGGGDEYTASEDGVKTVGTPNCSAPEACK